MKPYWLMMAMLLGLVVSGCGGGSDPAADAKVGEDTGNLTEEQMDMEKSAGKASQ